MSDILKKSEIELIGHKQELLADSVFRRLVKLGYEYDGGYNGLDRGWSRIAIWKIGKCVQANWRIDNEGIIKIYLSFTKFKREGEKNNLLKTALTENV